ncbi:hypothetical protein MAC_01052 [Metarhizium acridum CQMa 102]|uniref:Uncharacterized protein n=1 Tax=Metarhizium acridum (strain CQMa 102) TaxID=655827 RepID=E9DTV4_METAQ|nr:uncharacterized protein MAC_01052 [Metarhizium acridum CQMa 102]EFY92814.1 hypothetical protein MAC_01052 [Metarhizium acridum CQMa 102]
MSPAKEQTPNKGSDCEPADLAQAYRDLAKGEQAATALEANLTHLESKLDAMLAALEKKASGAEGKVQGDGESGK